MAASFRLLLFHTFPSITPKPGQCRHGRKRCYVVRGRCRPVAITDHQPTGSQPQHGRVARYLRRIDYLKSRLGIPLIASLNGDSLSGWVELGRELEAAGADALELNAWHLPGDAEESGSSVKTVT